LESERFGLRVGRTKVGSGAPDLDIAGMLEQSMIDENLDVLIVRAPARDVALPASLAALNNVRAVPADTLLYWEWSGPVPPPSDPSGEVSVVDDPQIVEHLVRSVFVDYPNHYAANPLFSREAALDGYCEWARLLVEGGTSSCHVLESPNHDQIGFGIVDWSSAVPDVRLAGVVPAFRGSGHYVRLVRGLVGEAVARGFDRLWISTQAHNIAPMRTWATLGFKPFDSFVTIHLIRDDLLFGR
jgi:GNAT superfamily N-acetyltransferase